MPTVAAELVMHMVNPPAPPACQGGHEMLSDHFHPLHLAVYRYLLHRVFDADQADDLAAETFYRAVRAIGRFRGNLVQLRAWLLRTAANLASSHCRRQRLWRLIFRRVASRPAVEAAFPAGDDSQALKAQQVRAALQDLAPRHQNVIVLRYFMEMSFEEIGDILRCRPDAVRVRLSRAVRAMRCRLGIEKEDT